MSAISNVKIATRDDTKNMKSQGNVSSTKYNFPITELKIMKFYGLVDKEFKIAILNKLSEVQKQKQENLRKTILQIHENIEIQNEILSKEIEYI